MSLFTKLVVASSVMPMIDIPDLNADFTPAPVRAAQTLANQILAIGVIAALIAVVVIAIILAFGGLDSRNKSRAWTALAIAGVAMAVMASASGYLTFFANIPLF